MSNEDNIKKEHDKQPKKEITTKDIILTCLLILIAILGVLHDNSKDSNKTPVDNPAPVANTISIEDFKKYEQQIYSLPQQCDADYQKAMDALAKNDAVRAYEQFDNAHYSCLDCFSKFSSLKLPEGLSSKQKEKLKDANRDFSIAYKSKSSASKNFKKGIDRNSVESMAKAKENLELFQTYLFRGAGKLTEVKTQIEEQNKKTD